MSRSTKSSVLKSLAGLCTAMICAFPSMAGSWTGKGADNKWSTPENWSSGTLPAEGENLTINCGGEVEIEIGSGEEVFVGQVLVGSGNPTSVRFCGGGKMTRHTDVSNNSYIYANSTIVLDGIEWNMKKGGFSINANAILEIRSGTCFDDGSAVAFLFDQSKVVVDGGSFRINRFSRNATAELVIRSGVLQYAIDNGTAQGGVGVTFAGGTLIVPPSTVKNRALLPTGEGARLVARNTSTAVDAFETDGSYLIRGTIEGTNNWSAGSLFPYFAISGNVNVGGSGSWVIESLYMTGGGNTRAKLGLNELVVGNLNYGNTGSIAEFYNDATLRTFGADIAFTGIYSYWHGLLSVDTTDYMTPTEGRTIYFDNNYPQTTVGLKTFSSGEGKGSVRLAFPNLDTINKRHFDNFEVGAGTKLSLEGGTLVNGTVRVGTLTVGAGATLSITGANLRVAAETKTAAIDPTATVEYRTNTELTKERYRIAILDMGPYGDVSDVNITTPNGLPTGWSIKKDGPIAYLTDNEEYPNPDNASGNNWIWVGADGGNWSNGKNWAINKNNTAHGSYAGKNQAVQFVGLGTTVVTNDVEGLAVARIEMVNGSAVVRFRGYPITLSQTATGSTAPLLMNSKNRTAAIFENKVIGTSTAAFFAGSTCGYFSFLGGLEAKNATFWTAGETRFGGTSEVRELKIYGVRNSDGQGGNNPSISLVTNALVQVTAQTNDLAYSGTFSLRIDEGARLWFANPMNEAGVKYRPTFAFYNTTIHGLLDLDIPFDVVGTQAFYGHGAIDISSTRSDVTGAGTVAIGDGLTLYSDGFSTVTEEADNPVTILAVSKATIGAKRDWTYGPARTATATTPEARALRTEGVYAPLTIDTQDPDTDIGHTITFADPICAKGDVVKQGTGTLVFAAAGNTVEGRFSVQGGKIALGGALKGRRGWVDVLTAKEFVGVEDAAAEGLMVRIVAGAEEMSTLQMRLRPGMAISFR